MDKKFSALDVIEFINKMGEKIGGRIISPAETRALAKFLDKGEVSTTKTSFLIDYLFDANIVEDEKAKEVVAGGNYLFSWTEEDGTEKACVSL